MNSYIRLVPYNDIDWNKITNDLIIQDGVSITTDPSRWDLATEGYSEIYKLWQEAQFNTSAIKWTNYYPGKHFSQSVMDLISTHLKIIPIRAWVSRIDPGYFAPWHWDVDDNEQEYLAKGEIHRFSIFIEPPTFGHIFVVGNDYLINEPLGSVIKWINYREWHSGINAGMTPKFMLHILGHQSP